MGHAGPFIKRIVRLIPRLPKQEALRSKNADLIWFKVESPR